MSIDATLELFEKEVISELVNTYNFTEAEAQQAVTDGTDYLVFGINNDLSPEDIAWGLTY